MDIFSQLIDIVGENRVSNRPEECFIYSCDSGAQPPRHVDYVVMPKTPEEVRQVVLENTPHDRHTDVAPCVPSRDPGGRQPFDFPTDQGVGWT